MIQTVLLGDLITDLAMGPFGSNLKVDSFIESGVPVVKGGNLHGYEVSGEFSFVSEEKAQSLKRSLAYPDDIIITHRGTLGQVSIVPHGRFSYYLASQSQLRMTPNKDRINPRYLLYYLRSSVGQRELMQHTSQVGVPSIATPTKAVKSFKIQLPDLKTQQKIVDTIGTFDEKIELNRKMNETLEQMGQALFRHYFIDNPEVGRWDKVALSDLCIKIASGGTPPTKNEEYYGGEVSWYSTKELQDNFLLGSDKMITEAGLVNSSAKLFPENTLVMAIYAAPTVGRLGILTSESSFNQAACGLVAKPEIGYEFVYLLLLHSRLELNNMANGAAQQNISVGKVRDFKIFKPNADSVSEFRGKVEPIFHQIKNNTKEIQTLTTLRDTLLPRLISGKIKL